MFVVTHHKFIYNIRAKCFEMIFMWNDEQPRIQTHDFGIFVVRPTTRVILTASRIRAWSFLPDLYGMTGDHVREQEGVTMLLKEHLSATQLPGSDISAASQIGSI